MPHRTSEAIGREWIEAFNARDLTRLLALYAEDCTHTSPKLRAQKPETQGKVAGKAALRAWWADAFARLPALRYELKTLTANAERVFLEYDRVLAGEPTMLVAEAFEVRDGLIVASRVFHG